MNLKVGFSGTNGWLANHVIKSLESKSISIIDFDKITRKLADRPREQEIDKLDWFFHFGSKTNIEKSFIDPFSTYKNNLISTLTAIEIAKISKAKLLYLSSYIYGDPKYQPIDENHIVKPNNPYMSSKWIAEQICTDICQQLNISLTVFRLFNIYGSGLKRGRLISDLLYNVLHNEDLVLNDPSPVRDYLYIEDFIDLILCMLNLDKSPAGIFNVGSGKSYTNIEVAKTFQSIINSLLEINILSKPRKNDISICTVDIKKLVNHFNWEPKYNLDEGIQHIFKLVSIENPISE